jgi:hypothetical protein
MSTAGADLVGRIRDQGVGARGRATTVAGLAFPGVFEGRLAEAVARRRGFELVAPWYESDHTMFAMRGIPSLTLTCANPGELASILHGPADTAGGLDPAILGSVASFVIDWLLDTRA